MSADDYFDHARQAVTILSDLFVEYYEPNDKIVSKSWFSFYEDPYNWCISFTSQINEIEVSIDILRGDQFATDYEELEVDDITIDIVKMCLNKLTRFLESDAEILGRIFNTMQKNGIYSPVQVYF